MLVVLLLSHLLHPFHVSVTEIKYKGDQKALQLSTRVFLDDLEQGLQAYTGRNNLDITEESSWEMVQQELGRYLLTHVKLWDEKGKAFELSYLGAEIEDDVVWCYLEVEKVKKLKTVKVRNSTLTEAFSDQENLIHFRVGEKVKSERLYLGEESAVFDWGE